MFVECQKRFDNYKTFYNCKNVSLNDKNVSAMSTMHLQLRKRSTVAKTAFVMANRFVKLQKR